MFIGELSEAQLTPANKLCAKQRLLLAWPQGSGKTIISIAAAEKLLELGLIRHVTVLCQTSTGWQWEEQIKEFTDHDNVRLVKATNKSSREYRTYSEIYTIIPYSVFRKDYKEIPKTDLIICDEAQEFSNFKSRTFELIKKFRSKYRWALTGTAISNKLEELYAIMQWIDPYCLPRWKRFEELHIVRNRNTKQIISYKNLRPLHKFLSVKRMDRKTVDELDLPELLPDKKYIEKDQNVISTEHTLYSALSDLSNRTTNATFDAQISRALHEVRQAVCGEPKLKYCNNLISNILAESDSNRIVVFSFYKQPLYDLHRLLNTNSEHIQSEFFTGDQDSDGKRAAKEALRTGEAKVLLCSNAGAAGLDLPFANYVIHLDVPFSFGIMDQRSKRIQRHSSIFSTVIVIFLLVKDSIEEYYYQVTLNKGKLGKAVQEGGESTVVMRDESLKEYLETHGSVGEN